MLITAKDLANVQFAHAFHWDIEFPDFGGSFFPATIVQDTKLAFNNESVNYGPSEFTYPSNAKRGGLTVQLIELDDWAIYFWLKDWKEVIFTDYYEVGLLGHPNVARIVKLYEQGWDKSIVNIEMLQVIPSSEVSYEKSSSKNDTINVSVSFDVVGE